MSADTREREGNVALVAFLIGVLWGTLFIGSAVVLTKAPVRAAGVEVVE